MISGPVGLKSEPTFSTASASRLEATTSSSQSFTLSGSMSFVFSELLLSTLLNGLLKAEKITATIPIIIADTPTATAALVGVGTQTCCRRADPDKGVGVGLDEGLPVGLDVGDVDGVGDEGPGLGEVDVPGVGEEDVTEESEITETELSPRLVTNISFFPES